VFYFYGKVASLIRRCGLSVHCQLHIILVMLPTKKLQTCVWIGWGTLLFFT